MKTKPDPRQADMTAYRLADRVLSAFGRSPLGGAPRDGEDRLRSLPVVAKAGLNRDVGDAGGVGCLHCAAIAKRCGICNLTEPASFDDIVATVADLEKRINVGDG